MAKAAVLIGNNHLKELGGSEVFTYTLIKAIKELGYNVYFTTFVTGLVSKKCEEFATYIPPEEISKYHFDKAILSHNSIVKLPIKSCSIIQICHGMLPGLEEPSPLADYHVVVAQRLLKYVCDCGFENEVINNPVDLSKFKPLSKINNKPKSVLSLCQGEEANENIKKVCERMGLEFLSFSKTRSAVWDLHTEINKADIVVSIGRGVYEAMACGRNVIVYDSRWYAPNRGDGYINKDNFFLSHTSNCIGNEIGIDLNVDLLEKEILKYSKLDGDWNHEITHYLFDSLKVARKLLAMNNPHRYHKYKRYFCQLKLKIRHKFKPIKL